MCVRDTRDGIALRLARDNKHTHTYTHNTYTRSSFLKINVTAPFNEVACKLSIAVCLHTLRLPIQPARFILKPADIIRSKKLQIAIIRNSRRERNR